jgi:hypothetical protein
MDHPSVALLVAGAEQRDNVALDVEPRGGADEHSLA